MQILRVWYINYIESCANSAILGQMHMNKYRAKTGWERDGQVQLKGSLCSSLLYNVYFTLSTVHCAMCTVHRVLFTVQCALHAAPYILCTQVNHKIPDAVSSREDTVLVTGQHRQRFGWFGLNVSLSKTNSGLPFQVVLLTR